MKYRSTDYKTFIKKNNFNKIEKEIFPILSGKPLLTTKKKAKKLQKILRQLDTNRFYDTQFLRILKFKDKSLKKYVTIGLFHYLP